MSYEERLDTLCQSLEKVLKDLKSVAQPEEDREILHYLNGDGACLASALRDIIDDRKQELVRELNSNLVRTKASGDLKSELDSFPNV